MLFVHGSPLSDVDSFKRDADDEFDRRLLDGAAARTVIFGHSHLQFRRSGPDDTVLVNPGSVGMPLDGDVRAAWATWDGDFEFRRTEYDVERAVAAARALESPMRDVIANRYLHASD
jgi:diadenosine tetraphosphatase ApaH/serine/threonine PP2A family protein phosphatase